MGNASVMNPIQKLRVKLALQNKVNQWEIANELGISESQLSRILNGRIKPSAELLSGVKRLVGSHFLG